MTTTNIINLTQVIKLSITCLNNDNSVFSDDNKCKIDMTTANGTFTFNANQYETKKLMLANKMANMGIPLIPRTIKFETYENKD